MITRIMTPAVIPLKDQAPWEATKTNLPFVGLLCATLVFFSLVVEPGHAAGTVVAWGDDSSSQSSVPPGLNNATAVAGGTSHSLALKAGGTVIGWGDNTYGETHPPANLTNAVAIAAGDGYSLALRSSGTVVGWGKPGTPPADLSKVVAIAANSTNLVALTSDGNVVCWGSVPPPPAEVTNLVAIAAGYSHSVALSGNGKVFAWGNNTWGQTNVPAGLSNVVALSAGQYHSLALKSDGKVIAWGDNSWGQSTVPAGLSNVIAIAAGAYGSLALKQDGTVAVWGDNTFFQTNIPAGLSNVAAIASGSLHNLAIQGDGSPTITLQPVSEYNAGTGTAYFSVMAAGLAPLSYQWLQDGTNIDGATNSLLVLTSLSTPSPNIYSVIVTNSLGAVTSIGVQLPPAWRPPPCEPPLIVSALAAAGKQGTPFSYTIIGQNNPTSFTADGLPKDLGVNPTNGAITGTPLESGTFNVTLGTANLCTSAQTNLTLTIASSLPVITSSLTAYGTEQTFFSYQITAAGSPTRFGAQNLPQGLGINTTNGLISGSPLYAGNFTVTLLASNTWGVGTANLQLYVFNKHVTGLSIANLLTNYSSPYLLNFQFSLRDNDDPALGNAIVTDPRNLQVTVFEDDATVSPTETSVLIQGVNQGVTAKVLKAYEVLDFSRSIAYNNGISDAVDTEVSAAQAIINQQPDTAQFGVYEFHQEDEDPQLVQSLTTDKTVLNTEIAGIWTNYVKNFPAGSRCWDALVAAIQGLGVNNDDEQHVVIFCSDGFDTSSSHTVQDVINTASNANVQVYCVGFGSPINTATLQSITSQTQGRYYEATDLTELAANFAQIGKDLSGQYFLRWATLQRGTNVFQPSFQITYQGITAYSPTNPPPFISGTNYVVDTNSSPATTNEEPIYTTNYVISPYIVSDSVGDVKVGSLRLVSDAVVQPSAITLRATYVPRYVRQIRLHYRVNWPCTVSLESTNAGEMLHGWSLTQTNDGAGGQWATLTSSNQQDLATSIPFATFGPLLNFGFHDVLNASNAFSLLDVDNTIYTNTGNQSFVFENTNAFITSYPVLPYGTPVPWLIDYGFSDANNWVANETNDVNGDGLPTWQDYVAGLNPTNTSSAFIVRNLAPTGPFGQYQITFTTTLNRFYRVESSSDLLTWEAVQDGIAGTGGDVTVPDDRYLIGAPTVFYRVVVYY